MPNYTVDSTTPGTEPLVPTQKDGNLLRTRVKNAVAAREIYQRLRKADEQASRDRARIQSLLDGEAPYDQADLVNQGLGEICNVNWGQAEQLLSMATAPYIDLLESVDTFITTPTKFGDPQLRAEWETIISEEFTRMIRNWPEFFPRYLYLVQQYLAHGVVVTYFDDDIDFRFQVSPLGDFLIPRQTRASDEEIEVACFVRSVPPHELYRKIEDEEVAKQVGWNVAATKKAIVNAHQINLEDTAIDNWEKIQREFKNNDIGYSSGAMATEVKLVYMFVKELDGTVSQYIFCEDDQMESKEFLFQRRHQYENSAQAFSSFIYGIGTNGYFHSIRGMISKVFSIIQALNRLRCRFFDGLMLSSMQMIEPENEDALQDLSILHLGPYMVKPANVKIINTDSPNFGSSVIPGMGELNSLLQQQAGQYSTEAVFQAQKERSKFEIQAQLESLANINIASLSLFYKPLERTLKEMLRRVTRRDYFPQDPGGEEVMDFRKRCVERGVPEEAIFMVDIARARIVRAIGNGSSAARSSIMQQLFQLSSNFDPQGRQMVIRDLTRTIGGVEAADRYAPAPEQQRPPMEAKIAMLENNQMVAGEAVEVLPSEMHLIQLPIHVGKLEEFITAIDQGQADLAQVTPIMVLIYEHALKHAEFTQGDPSYPMFKQKLQQIGEYIGNGIKAVQKLQRQQQEQAQTQMPGEEAQPQAAPQAAGNLEQKTIEAQVKLRFAEEKHQQEMRLREEQARQAMAIADAEAAARIARTSVPK